MAFIEKIFARKGNRQFSRNEEILIDALNNLDNFIADEAFINFTHTELFAIDKELGQFLKIESKSDCLNLQFLEFNAISTYLTSIKDRANEEWMENFSKWKTQKKFIRSISVVIQSDSQEDMTLYFSKSENKDGDRVASIPIKRALFSMEKWDEILFQLLDK